MRALIQRITEARVTVADAAVGTAGPGLLILLGVEEADSMQDVQWLAGKVARLRLFNDAHGVMNLSLCETGGDALVVSQFTLHASTKKGNRPSYIKAARPEVAIPLYEAFVKALETELQKPVATGTFGAMMQVHLVNDGPVTIWIDSQNKE